MWSSKTADIICYILISLVFLYQGNINKFKKLAKIVNIEEKIFISPEELEEEIKMKYSQKR